MALVISISSAVFSISISIIALVQAVRARRFTFLNELFREYRSAEFGKAVQSLWNSFGDKESSEEMEEIYKAAYDKNADLHYQRRTVSQFYQHMAAAATNCLIPLRALREIWPPGSGRIISKIIVPIERDILPKLAFKDPERDQKSPGVQVLQLQKLQRFIDDPNRRSARRVLKSHK